MFNGSHLVIARVCNRRAKQLALLQKNSRTVTDCPDNVRGVSYYCGEEDRIGESAAHSDALITNSDAEGAY